MSERRTGSVHPAVLGPRDGEITGAPEAVTDRFMIGGAESGGRMAMVEDGLAPHALAAPLHRHGREDEWIYVLEGRVGLVLGDEEIFAQAGDLIRMPRGQWHTFWNGGDQRARVLIIVSPGGLEELFRELGNLPAWPDPATMAKLAARYGADVDFERTAPVIERHALAF